MVTGQAREGERLMTRMNTECAHAGMRVLLSVVASTMLSVDGQCVCVTVAVGVCVGFE